MTAQEYRNIDTLTDEVYFKELLEFASQVCFGEQTYARPFKKSHDNSEQITHKLGARGLRNALDYIAYPDEYYQGIVAEDDETEYILTDSYLRHTEDFSDQPKIDLIHQAEQFGQKLLETSYLSLGQDVFEKIDQIKHASTDVDMFDVITWMASRLRELSDSNRGLDDGPLNSHYHPVRLSPLAVGVYPRHDLSPTCLGVSVIAASFFHKAGLTQLHAGVMETQSQSHLGDLVSSLNYLKELSSEKVIDNPTMTEAIAERIDEIGAELLRRRNEDFGFHSANLVRMQSKWLLLDSNFDVISLMPDEECDRNYALLKEFKTDAPGLELSLRSESSSDTFLLAMIFASLEPPALDELTLRKVILEEDESTSEKLFGIIEESIKLTFERDGRLNINPQESQVGSDIFHKVFERYVLWGDDLIKVLDCCKKDQAYLERRIADLKNLWVAILLAVLVDHGSVSIENIKNYDEGFSQPHTLLEVGLPAQRIGMAVLKDFDDYCGGNLSPSFWTNNWASQIPIADLMRYHNKRPGQSELAFNHANHIKLTDLRYAKINGNLKKFIPNPEE